MKKRFALIAASLLVAGTSIFTACKKEETPKKYAQINVFHVSPDAPRFNVFADSTSQINDYVMGYGDYTGYKQIEADKRIFTAQTYRVDSADTVAYKMELMLKEKATYSFFLIDSFRKMSGLLVADELSNPPAGKAFVRFIHLSPNAPRVDLVKTSDSSTVFGNLSFKDVTAFTAMPAGVYDWDIRRAGSDTVVAVVPTMVFNTGKIYTVYLKGLVNGAPKKQLEFSLITNRF